MCSLGHVIVLPALVEHGCDQPKLHPRIRHVPEVVDQVAPWVVDPVQARYEGHHRAHFGTALDHEPAADEKNADDPKLMQQVLRKFMPNFRRKIYMFSLKTSSTCRR